MSDLESFSGHDTGEGMDPASFERFKEQMAAAAAQLKAIQAGEQKQKKKEDELVKILLKFIQSGSQKRDILLLVTRLLELNIPAAFIVSILLINHQEMQTQLNIKLLPSSFEKIAEKQLQAVASGQLNGPQTLPDRYMPNQTIPLKVKIAIDAWIQEMVKYAFEKPHRMVETALDTNGLIHLPMLQLGVLCLEDFLQQNAVETKYEDLKEFMNVMFTGIMKRLQEQIKNRKELKEGKG